MVAYAGKPEKSSHDIKEQIERPIDENTGVDLKCLEHIFFTAAIKHKLVKVKAAHLKSTVLVVFCRQGTKRGNSAISV